MPSDARPPCSTRDSTSLPLRSVPSGWPGDSGGKLASSTSPPTGEGTSPAAGATRHAAAITASIAAGTTMPRGSARSPFAARPDTPTASLAAAMTDSRVEHRIEQVDDEVRDDGRDREHEHDGQDHGHVARVDRLQQQLTEPRQREDLLDDDGAADQVAGVHA